MLLTDQERDKFALWCERQALSANGMAEQFAKLNIAPQLVKQMVNRERMMAEACTFIAKYLRSLESQTIGGMNDAES